MSCSGSKDWFGVQEPTKTSGFALEHFLHFALSFDPLSPNPYTLNPKTQNLNPTP